MANGNTADNVYFPFAGDAAEFETRGIQRKIEKLAPEVIEKLRGIKPYRGGNDVLWGLGKLANVDKHRMVVPVGTVAGARLFQYIGVQNAKVGLRIPPPNARLDKGIRFCNLGSHGTIRFGGSGPNIVFQNGGIIFGDDVDVFREWPVIPTLDQLGPLVLQILRDLEPHC